LTYRRVGGIVPPMALQKTSVQLDTAAVIELKARYGVGISELIRLALEYVRETEPTLGAQRFCHTVPIHGNTAGATAKP
jgi:hypothetical protein